MQGIERISKVIDWLVMQAEGSPALQDIAAVAGMEETAFQKLFTRYVGVSPKRFLDALKYSHARELLAGGGVSTLEAAYAAGVSGNGRLNDLFVRIEAATPGEVRRKGEGMRVVYGFAPSPFGELILARTGKGICYIGFLVEGARDECLARIFEQWPRAEFVHDDAEVAADLQAVVDICMGVKGAKPVNLHVHGTNFQMQVWRALLKIPAGSLVSYQGIGEAIGAKRGAARAIGGAVGANPVSLLIPCHRVIQASGVLNNYGWGSARKKALLGVECGARGIE